MMEMLIAYQKTPSNVARNTIDCNRVQTVIDKITSDKSIPNKLYTIVKELNAETLNPDWSVVQINAKTSQYVILDSYQEDRYCIFDDWLVWRPIYRICFNFVFDFYSSSRFGFF